MNGDEKRVWILLCSRSFLLVVALSHSSLHIFHQKPSPKRAVSHVHLSTSRVLQERDEASADEEENGFF